MLNNPYCTGDINGKKLTECFEMPWSKRLMDLFYLEIAIDMVCTIFRFNCSRSCTAVNSANHYTPLLGTTRLTAKALLGLKAFVV